MKTEKTQKCRFYKIECIGDWFFNFGPEVSTSINKMSFLDFRGCMLKSEIEIFIFKKNIKLEKLDLQTKESSQRRSCS
jgi:hypothetical protein